VEEAVEATEEVEVLEAIVPLL